MKKYFQLTWADVSRHRPVLYGFAALWIALLHMNYRIPSTGALSYLRGFQTLGACGVEMFVLLTGAGLYRSMERDPGVLSFYKKRFARVFLPAVFVAGACHLITADSVLEWFAQTSFFFYWFGVDAFWYVGFILTMYLLYPLIYRIQKSRPWLLWIALLLSLGALLIISTRRSEWITVCRRGVSRIPVFLFSCILAPRLERNFRFSVWAAPASVGVLFLSLQLGGLTDKAYYFWRTLGYVGLAIFFILVITWLCEHVRLGILGRLVYRCFAFCGSISLEIYLLFDRVSRLLSHLPVYTSGRISRLYLELFGLMLTLLIGWLLQRACRILTKGFGRLSSPDRNPKSNR